MNHKYKETNYKSKTVKIWQTLMLHNCLPLGKQAKFTSKNVAQYLLGSRNDYNLFKFNEIKHLLLKFTPLIETLFRAKLVLKAKVGVVQKTRYGKPTPPKDPERYKEWYERMKNVRMSRRDTVFYYKTVENKRPVKILFASINPTYDKIIKDAAIMCQMTAHTNRWLCGSITANSTPLSNKLKVRKEWYNFSGKSKVERQFEDVFSSNKEAKEQRYKWHQKNMLSQRPALAIIPDISNNDMILRETFAKDIPVIGLVNSDESTKIAYPIFGNSSSVQVVHFFCSFLSLLIAKAFIQQEYKQASHRILNRTRAYLDLSKKTVNTSSVDTFSKREIILNQQIFPTVTSYRRRQLILRGVYPKRKLTRHAIFKNVSHFAEYDSTSQKNTTSKLRNIGRKPYWKNINLMIDALRLRLKWKFQAKRHKNIDGENYSNEQIKIVQSETINRMFSIKSDIRQLEHSINLDKSMLDAFIRNLKRIKVMSMKSELVARKHIQWKMYKQYYALAVANKNLNEIQENLTGIAPYQWLRPKYSKDWWKKKTRMRKLTKRKLLVKTFGHKYVVRKQVRDITQWRIKRIVGQKITPTYKIKLGSKLSKLKKLKQKLMRTVTKATAKKDATLNALIRVHSKLSIQKNTIKATKYLTATAIFKNLRRSKTLLKAMLKEYPYFTLTAKALIDTLDASLGQTVYKTLLFELNNKKKNPYAFVMKNFKRSKTITNNLLWDKLYYKNWIVKTHKKHLKQKAPNKYLKSKYQFRGAIRPNTGQQIYYFRRLVQLQKHKNFPKSITKIKKSFRSTKLSLDKSNLKSIGHYIWYQRKFALKFHRTHQVVPKLAKIAVPYTENYRRKYKKNARKQKQLKIENANIWTTGQLRTRAKENQLREEKSRRQKEENEKKKQATEDWRYQQKLALAKQEDQRQEKISASALKREKQNAKKELANGNNRNNKNDSKQ